ncbi:MAG: RNA polymerase sigma factor [Butyrivibrio sp.]|nr:RNA polymerase sigma factor [Acetatifactor muris]MCM1561398.1 RNA polymerase sigma factor [Butyrivibrio sp.]
MEDSEIVLLLQKRSEQAIEEIKNRYGRKLTHIAVTILENQEDAEECVNDTLWKAWKAIPPAAPRFLFAFLAKICRNAALDRINYRNADKRQGIILELTAEMEQCIPARPENDGRESRELAALLNRFLKEQPPEKRIIFMRRYWYGESVAEIAERYHISEANVKTSLFRTRKKLRTYLEKEDYVL